MAELTLIDDKLPIDLGVEDGIVADLKIRLSGLKADTHHGYQLVSVGIAEATKLRTNLDKSRIEMKAPYVKEGKKIDAEAKRMKTLILEVETPLRAEKKRVYDDAELKRKESEEAERLAVEAEELAAREKQEAEEAAERAVESAAREEERKVNEAEAIKLAIDRDMLAEDRRKLELDKAKVDAEKQAALAKEEAIAAVALAEKHKQESIAADKKFAELEDARLAEAKVEADRLAEERKPDCEKLSDFADRIAAVKAPVLTTDWGRDVLNEVADYILDAVEILRVSP